MKYEETRRVDLQKSKNPNQNDDDEEVRSDPLRDMPEWLKEFRKG